jgi:hypothetical protein
MCWGQRRGKRSLFPVPAWKIPSGGFGGGGGDAPAVSEPVGDAVAEKLFEFVGMISAGKTAGRASPSFGLASVLEVSAARAVVRAELVQNASKISEKSSSSGVM